MTLESTIEEFIVNTLSSEDVNNTRINAAVELAKLLMGQRGESQFKLSSDDAFRLRNNLMITAKRICEKIAGEAKGKATSEEVALLAEIAKLPTD